MIPFLKREGIQRWLLNSISILVMVVVVAAFSLIIKNYYDSSILITDMESKAPMAASYFSTEASSYSNYNSSGIISPRPRIASAFEDARGLNCSFSTLGAR